MGHLAQPNHHTAMATQKEIQTVLVGFPRRLTWDDFEKRDDAPGEEERAQVSSEVTIRKGWVAFGGKHGVYLYGPKVTLTLKKTETWARDDVRGKAVVLDHEQGHFDIQGLLARDLAIALIDFRFDPQQVKSLFLNNMPIDSMSKLLYAVVVREANRLESRLRKLTRMLQNNVKKEFTTLIPGMVTRERSRRSGTVFLRMLNPTLSASRRNSLNAALLLLRICRLDTYVPAPRVARR